MNLRYFKYSCMTTFDHKIIFTQFIKVYRKTVINKPYKNHLSDACIYCSCNAENLLIFSYIVINIPGIYYSDLAKVVTLTSCTGILVKTWMSKVKTTLIKLFII